MPIDAVVVGDEEIKLVLPPKLERVLVVSVVLTYGMLIVDAVAEDVMMLEDSKELFEVGEGSNDVDVVEGMAVGVKLGVGVKEVSDGAGEGGGEERTD